MIVKVMLERRGRISLLGTTDIDVLPAVGDDLLLRFLGPYTVKRRLFHIEKPTEGSSDVTLTVVDVQKSMEQITAEGSEDEASDS